MDLLLVFLLLLGVPTKAVSPVHAEREVRLKNVRQLTFGGINQNPAFSPDGRRLAFSSRELPNPDRKIQQLCKQLYLFDLTNLAAEPQTLSDRYGTFESAVFDGNSRDLVAVSDVKNFGPLEGTEPQLTCRPRGELNFQSRSFDRLNFEIYHMNVDHSEFYPVSSAPRGWSNVEVTASPRGLLVYVQMDTQGRRVLTDNQTQNPLRIDEFEFVGGPSFSHDGSEVVVYGWKRDEDAGAESQSTVSLGESRQRSSLLPQGDSRLKKSGLFSVRLSDRKVSQLTKYDKLAAFLPSFHPIEKMKILFAGNNTRLEDQIDPNQHTSLFILNRDTGTLKQITHLANDSFPVLSPDAKQLVWSSTRNSTVKGEWNLFIADFVEYPPSERTLLQKILHIIGSS